MAGVDKLIAGYRVYRATRFEQHRQIFSHRQNLKETPHTLVLAGCSLPFPVQDVLGVSVGEIFVLRNLGGVAPPYGDAGAGGGAEAVIEYAVSALHVDDILVLAHSGSDGLKLLMQDDEEPAPAGKPGAMTRWLDAVASTRSAARKAASSERNRGEGEKAAVRTSVAHLKDYPCVQLRVESARPVHIHGWYLDIAEGLMYALDHRTGLFHPL